MWQPDLLRDAKLLNALPLSALCLPSQMLVSLHYEHSAGSLMAWQVTA